MAGGGGAGSDSDSDAEHAVSVSGDVRFPEGAYGAALTKPNRPVRLARDRRSPAQIAAECARLRRRFQDAEFPPGPGMLFRDPAGGPAISAMHEVRGSGGARGGGKGGREGGAGVARGAGGRKGRAGGGGGGKG